MEFDRSICTTPNDVILTNQKALKTSHETDEKNARIKRNQVITPHIRRRVMVMVRNTAYHVIINNMIAYNLTQIQSKVYKYSFPIHVT